MVPERRTLMLILTVALPPTLLAAASSIFSDEKPHTLSQTSGLEIDDARSPGLCFSGASVLLRPSWVHFGQKRI